MADPIRITVWNEFRHEKTKPQRSPRSIQHGIHGAIAGSLTEAR